MSVILLVAAMFSCEEFQACRVDRYAPQTVYRLSYAEGRKYVMWETQVNDSTMVRCRCLLPLDGIPD